MYLERAGEEDKKMTDSWKADADGILIFVSLGTPSRSPSQLNPEAIDWFVLRCCRDISRSIGPGPPAELPRHLRVLPCKYLSTPC
jgi:hypothetical protein